MRKNSEMKHESNIDLEIEEDDYTEGCYQAKHEFRGFFFIILFLSTLNVKKNLKNQREWYKVITVELKLSSKQME